MSFKSWEDIYREKETQDLYNIYRGQNYPTLDQRKLALKILKEREFDFDNTDALESEWNRVRRKSKEEYEMNRPVITFINKNHGYIVSTIFGIAFLVFYIGYFSGLDEKDIDFDAYVVTFGPLIIVIWGMLTQLLINKKKR